MPLYYDVLFIFALAALLFGLNFHHQLLSLALYLQNTNLIAQRLRDGTGLLTFFISITGTYLSHRLFTTSTDFGDFLIWRKPLTSNPTDVDLPSYQLACVVDDALTAITEVVRGRDLLKSTARQILLQRALHYPTPAYFHCDLMRDANGVRLAKRHDALALRTLRANGLSPADVLALF